MPLHDTFNKAHAMGSAEMEFVEETNVVGWSHYLYMVQMKTTKGTAHPCKTMHKRAFGLYAGVGTSESRPKSTPAPEASPPDPESLSSSGSLFLFLGSNCACHWASICRCLARNSWFTLLFPFFGSAGRPA